MNIEKQLNDWGAMTFVGDNYAFYEEKWKGKEAQKSFSSWNWAAFFLGTWWLLYRKMYKEAAIYFPLSLIIIITGPIAIGLKVLLGIYANALYRNKTRRVLAKYDDIREDEAKEYIKKAGGTNLTAAILGFACYLVLIVSGLYYIGEQFPETEGTSEYSASQEAMQEVTTKGGEVTFTVPKDFKVEAAESQDLMCSSDTRDIAFNAYVFEAEDFAEDQTNQSILDMQIEQGKIDFDLEKVTDKALNPLGEHVIQELYEAKVDGGFKYYMYFASIELEDTHVVTLFMTKPSKWTRDRDQFDEIIKSAHLTKTVE